jgi:hypothetical protein
MMYGELREGPKALTVIALPRGRFRTLVLFCDNNRQNMLPVELRVAFWHNEYGFQVRNPVLLDGSKGPVEIQFGNSHKISHEDMGGISIERQDEGEVHVGWTVL